MFNEKPLDLRRGRTTGSAAGIRIAAAALAAALSALGAGGVAAQKKVVKTDSAAQTAAGDQQQVKVGTTTITADKFDFDLDKHQHLFVGRVLLVSEKNSVTSRMTADRMTVQMTPKQEIDWLKATGHVTLNKDNAEDKTHLDGTGDSMEYFETDKKANLQGTDVVVHESTAKLSKPAEITGSRVDMDQVKKINIVTRKPDEQAKVHIEPNPQEGKPAPEPVDLIGDRIEMNNATQEYIATGKPVMVRPSSKLQGKRIRFLMDEKGNDVKIAYADEDVIFDGKNEKGTVTHSTGDNGVYTHATNELVLTGDVECTTLDPGDSEPTYYKGAKFIYDTKKRTGHLTGDEKHPAFVRLPANKTQPKPQDGAKPSEDKNPKPKSTGTAPPDGKQKQP